MKQLLVIMTLAIFTGSLALAQSPAKKEGHPTKDEAEVTALERQWCDAYKRRDSQTLTRILLDDFIYIDDEGQVYNKAQYMELVLQQNVTSYTLEEVSVHVYGSAAIMFVRNAWKYTVNGNDGSGDFRSTDVFAKHNGQWRVVSSQDTRIPKKGP